MLDQYAEMLDVASVPTLIKKLALLDMIFPCDQPPKRHEESKLLSIP